MTFVGIVAGVVDRCVKQSALRQIGRAKAAVSMHWEFDAAEIRGLREYVRLVADTVGLDEPCWYVQADHPADAYIALAERLPMFPTRDVALLWDEDNGWRLALESTSADLVVLCHLGDDLVPTPEDVAAAVREALHRTAPHDPGRPPGDGRDELRARLSNYAVPRTESLQQRRPPETQRTAGQR